MAIIIGFIYSWEFTLFILLFIPAVLGTGLLQMKLIGGVTREGQAALEDAGKVRVCDEVCVQCGCGCWGQGCCR